MEINGNQLIGNNQSREGSNTFQSISPNDNTPASEALYAEATPDEINRAVQLAAGAFGQYRKMPKEDRAKFLVCIADEILALDEQLVRQCVLETGLPEGRIIGERGRTVNQLRLFAEYVRDGNWIEARVDTAIPDRHPIPRPDLRSMLIPLGPVAVFGASNFPLAFSVAGGDTVSALAAGCPVVFKAHPAHPVTCELVGRAIITAAQKTGMPEGVFSLIQGKTNEVGAGLVRHPAIKAVGFTGSHRGGMALFQLANAREEPIPVYAEMGSTNPVFILPGALKERGQKISCELVGSVTLGVGQFCTNPGMVFIEENASSQDFIGLLHDQVSQSNGGTMLTKEINQAYSRGVETLESIEGVAVKTRGTLKETTNYGQPALFVTGFEHFEKENRIAEEVFGPSTVLVVGKTRSEILRAAENLKGHLTATLHGTEQDLNDYQDLIEILEKKAGRLIINGYPTGVEVCHAMVHGGPYPATTDSRTTSVGTAAIKRFARPVCYQDFPQQGLPEPLRDENSWGIYRLVNGSLTREQI